MRTVRLMVGLLWRTFKERHLPDPADRIAAARQWLELNIRRATHLTPDLIRSAEAAGFAAAEFDSQTFRQLRHSEPWGSLSPTSLWGGRKTLPDRIAVAQTDVKAYAAINADNKILAVLITCGRVAL